MYRAGLALGGAAACAALAWRSHAFVDARSHTHAFARTHAPGHGALSTRERCEEKSQLLPLSVVAPAACAIAYSAPEPTSSRGAGACPVDHSAMARQAGAPSASSAAATSSGATSAPPAAASGAPAGACPVDHGKAAASSTNSTGRAGRGTVYNVYAQPIDPTNNMPAVANQSPSTGQQEPLSTSRVTSSIPKGGTDGSWLYPSPQMFWNALVRKGKTEGVAEKDIDMVVAIHNEMNERTWRALEQWESAHKSEHLPGEPSLRRFMGKPYELSLKAKVKQFFGYGLPFDRHDWYVDRGGREVRYIIDYYFNGEPGADVADRGPGLLEPQFTKGIHVDVRPALDDFSAVIDRLWAFPRRALAGVARQRWRAEGLDPATAPLETAAFALSAPSNPHAAPPSNPHAAATAASPTAAGSPAGAPEDPLLRAMFTKCDPILAKMREATDEDTKRSAHVAFNYCAASVVCLREAEAFMRVLEANARAGTDGMAGAEEEAAFTAMTQCVVDRMRARRSASPGKP